MGKFAEVYEGKVVCIFDWDVPGATPEYTDRIAVDVTDLDLDPRKRYTYADGQFTEIVEQSAPSVWLEANLAFSGGDGMSPIGIKNDGIDSFSVAITLKDKDGITLPVNAIFRVPIRRRGSDDIADIIKVTFVSGVANLTYTSTVPGHYYVHSNDLEKMEIAPGVKADYRITGTPEFKVYREL